MKINQNTKSGIEQPSFIHPSVKIGENVFIAAFSYVAENVVIGDNTRIYGAGLYWAESKIGNDCTLYPGVKIYNRSVIGDRVMIHANTVIGSDGFGFAPQSDGTYSIKLPRLEM